MAPSHTKKSIKKNAQGGFTVLEVAVAMVVVAIGLLSLASVIPLMKADVVKSDQRTEAVFLAQEAAEWLHGLAYSDSLISAGSHIDSNFAVPGFDRSWVVEDNTPMSGVKRITVSIDRDGGNTGESAQMVFLHSEAGR